MAVARSLCPQALRVLGSAPARLQPVVRAFSSASSSSSSRGERQKLLFTPGPLTTSKAVKEKMAKDVGSRDPDFIAVVKQIRERLLKIAEVSPEEGYECILMQGAGSMALEAMLTSSIPRTNGKLLIVSNGTYGERQEKICERAGIPFIAARNPWNEPITAALVEGLLEKYSGEGISHVSMVHHETTAGVLNHLEQVGRMLKEKHSEKRFIVDSISSFGAYRLPAKEWNVHYLAGSGNKCIEGVPGFAFVIAHRDSMLAAEGSSRSLTLDLQDQWQFMQKSGQFRFTPPTQSILGFEQALTEWEEEGGLAGRSGRYQKNYETLAAGMVKLGFEFYVKDDASRGYIITTFQVPDAEKDKWDFNVFYDKLKDRRYVIYPASLPPASASSAAAFRVGNIGQLFQSDVEEFVKEVEVVLKEMGFSVPMKA
eukprot:CAMPEP_0206454840 /NCGR_PEP_ID=MMETSP0324_2-20121206/21385_1 /ASSEMBLY_ACC=CAM_ASM_000836 /TAXON_ID=2866 /ORGANISM="Crypthecodinium cohnii, Strain Seligo" /LENGTH=425 /DNA_ID=CAMNT_0053925407 /DNA_START=82 /DNA_END=1359 /DNA_ORIENTATION=-